MQDATGYELLDIGGGARLERFGERTVDRPAPTALGARRDPEAWPTADLRFDRERGWTGPDADAGPWPVEIADLTLELRPTDAGQVGLFPEHEAMLSWLRRQTPGPVLNLFAYTGLVTLALAGRGRVRDPRRLVATDGRLGPAQRRTVRARGPPGPLDRRRRSRLRRARGPSRTSLRRRRARPADLRPRRRRPFVAARGRPRRAARRAAGDPRAGRLRAPDRPHARRSIPTGWPRPWRTASAVVPSRRGRRSRPGDAPTGDRLELGAFARLAGGA